MPTELPSEMIQEDKEVSENAPMAINDIAEMLASEVNNQQEIEEVSVAVDVEALP